MNLVPCPSCTRHVKTTEAACPFCKSALSSSELESAVIPGATQRLSRAAAFAFTASIAVTGCSSGSPGTGPLLQDSGSDAKGVVEDSGGIQPAYGGSAPAYGAPAPDSGVEDSGIQPPYGSFPIDAGDD